jgi:proteasomal ATPase-associated factor 1
MDINTSRFFPSGKVVLSGGADFALRIWDLNTGNCAAMLKGHTKGNFDLRSEEAITITSIYMI